MTNQEILRYKTAAGEELPVRTDGETVWMTVEQMVKLLGRTQSVISRHINSVFAEGELPKEGFMQILHKTSELRRRMAAAEGDIKQIKGGMNYLVKQLSVVDTPRPKIGFGAKPGETSTTLYGKLR